MNLKAAIFDLDGTLINSLHDLYLTMNDVLKGSGYSTISKDDVRKLIGNGARDFMRLSLPPHARTEENIDKHLTIYHLAYRKYGFKNTLPYPHITDILKKLKENNIKIAVLSNKPHAATVKVVKRFFPDIVFDAVLGQKDDFPPKPDISSAVYMADLLGEKPRDTAFIGDGDTDAVVGVKGGFYQVSVLWGYRNYDELKAAGAVNFINSPPELYDLFGISE
jgi:phosphoglycolate phosphatase